MENAKKLLAENLLKTISYIDMTEEQENLVVEYETEKLIPKIDELKATLTKERIEDVIHEWWLEYEIADETENNLIRYLND